ncbi:MAG: hypothetical protein B7Y99_04735 [Caulobacterales bacterium 32-69-10]|nr:MAG: hypothetical protein B7Y99_04735 [Caulobacterales bacterium 32-69-10]
MGTLKMPTLTPGERHEFASELSVAGRMWRALLNERLRDIDMSPARWSALYWLSRSPEGVSQTTLADLAGVEPATLVRTIDQLQEQELVERRPCLSDRRVNRLHLTPEAYPLVARMGEVADTLRRELMADFPDEEVRICINLMRRLRGRLEHANASPKRHARPRHVAAASSSEVDVDSSLRNAS